MRHFSTISISLLTTALLWGSTLTADIPPLRQDMRIERPKVQIQFRKLTGMKADFSGAFGNINFPNPDQAFEGFDISRSYSDGAVNRRADGEEFASTTNNWRYESASQLGDNTLLMNQYGATGFDGAEFDQDSGGGAGFEVLYHTNFMRPRRELGIGGQMGFGINEIRLRSSSEFTTDLRILTDSFDLLGIAPPAAPFDTANLPAADRPFIAASPFKRSEGIEPGAANVLANAELDGSLFTFRLGPTLDYRIHRNFSLRASVGANVMFASANFNVEETLSSPTGSDNTQEISERGNNWILGFYGDVNLVYALGERASVIAGAQLLTGDTVDFAAGERRATLDLKTLQGYTLGLLIRF